MCIAYFQHGALLWLSLTWQRRRRLQRWQLALSWLWRECEREIQNLCVQASVCCSGSGQFRSNLLWRPQTASGSPDEKTRDSRCLRGQWVSDMFAFVWLKTKIEELAFFLSLSPSLWHWSVQTSFMAITLYTHTHYGIQHLCPCLFQMVRWKRVMIHPPSLLNHSVHSLYYCL